MFIKAEAGTKSRNQNPEIRSQKKRKSVNAVAALLFWILDSDSWILLFAPASAFI
jgi:hypothetical protein